MASGVSDQPIGSQETQRGAVNRAKACCEEFAAKFGTVPDLAVGLEGGVEIETNEWMGQMMSCFAWMCVYRPESEQTKQSLWGMAKTATVPLPPEIVSQVRNGIELGHATDKIFSKINSKQNGGVVAELTCGEIDRTMYYEHALAFALAPFRPTISHLYSATDHI